MCEIEDYHFARVNRCVNHVGRGLLLKVFEWGFTLPPAITLRDYIKNKNNFNTNLYKRRYDVDQRDKIDNYDVHRGNSFDVAISYRLIQDTSDHLAPANDIMMWTTPNPTLEYYLYQIKSARNELIHNPMILDNASANRMIDYYRNLFVDLLDSAGTRYGKDVTNERSNLNDEIDKLINNILTQHTIDQDLREQAQIDLKEKMVKEGGKEMKDIYIKQSDLNPLNLICGTNFKIPVKRVYQKLEIRDCGRNSKNILIDNNDILRLNESFATVSELKDAVDLVILEGPTGSGKTTISKLLLSEWSEHPNCIIKGLLDYELLIYMECRYPDIDCIDKLLHSLMPLTYNDLQNPTETLSACMVLIVIDSLDELNEKSENLLIELLKLLKLKNVTGICTMRPTKTEDVFSLLPPGLKVVHLESRGISDGQRAPFVKIYHEELQQQGISKQSTKELMQHLNNSTSRLKEHLRYPINLVHLAFLWAISPEKVKCVSTATELYSSICEVVQIKLLERLAYNMLTRNLTSEERKALTIIFFDALCLEAMYNLTRKSFCILPKDSKVVLSNLCQENNLPLSDMLAAFLVTKNFWIGVPVETKYSISHTDMQEYLGACSIFKAVKEIYYQSTLKNRIGHESQYGVFSRNTLSRPFKRYSSMHFVSTPVTDVLEFFYPNRDIPYKDLQNVLKHLLGLFVLDDKAMSKYVAKDLVQLLEKSGIEQEDWLDIYAEAKSEKCMVKYLRKLCGDMLNGDIIVRDPHLAAYAKLLTPDSSTSTCGDVVDSTSAVTANSLVINLKEPPSKLPDLQLLMLHTMKLTCNVDIHLYYNWREPQSGVTTVNLNETNICCTLKVVRGSPNSNELSAISKTLEKLYISICDDDHARDVLPMLTHEKFPKLRALYIHLKCGAVLSEALDTPLNFGSTTNIDLFLSNVDDGNIAWVVEISQALQVQGTHGMFHCLYLPHNQLTSTGFFDLVNSLKQHNIKILVRIGVTRLDNDEQLFERLDVEATNQLRCRFLWYFSAERMEGW